MPATACSRQDVDELAVFSYCVLGYAEGVGCSDHAGGSLGRAVSFSSAEFLSRCITTFSMLKCKEPRWSDLWGRPILLTALVL
eukprot:14093-Eustigmatos_ZCMA.PRE.1